MQRKQAAPDQAATIEPFDYTAPAGVFMRRGRPNGWAPLSYRRFATAAEALSFINDELPVRFHASVILEVDDRRFDNAAIQGLSARNVPRA